MGAAEVGSRLDEFLAAHRELQLSRSQAKRSIVGGTVRVNDKVAVKAGTKLRLDDRVSGRIAPRPPMKAEPEDIPLDILHEDADLIVLVKPAGMVVHPAPGHRTGTLVHALLHHTATLSSGTDPLRPGIVHRLDKGTSGVMVVCKSEQAHRHLAAQFAAHSIERRYLTLAFASKLAESGTFESGHSRHANNRLRFTGHRETERRAITHYRVVERFVGGLALVACVLETGRTHQIRMHLTEAGAPILGDEIYGGGRSVTPLIDRPALHAELLGFVHPAGNSMRFTAPAPADFQGALDALRAANRAPGA